MSLLYQEEPKPTGGAVRDEILSREELQRLLERNNLHPEIGRPVYEAWTHNKPRPLSQSDLNESLRRANVVGVAPCDYLRWLRRLNSGKLRVQLLGAKEARLVERPVKQRDGWRYIPLNARG